MGWFSSGNNDESHGEQCRDRETAGWWTKPNPMGWGSNNTHVPNDSRPTMHGSSSEWNLMGKHGGFMNYGNTDGAQRIKQSGERPGRGNSGPGRK